MHNQVSIVSKLNILFLEVVLFFKHVIINVNIDELVVDTTFFSIIWIFNDA